MKGELRIELDDFPTSSLEIIPSSSNKASGSLPSASIESRC